MSASELYWFPEGSEEGEAGFLHAAGGNGQWLPYPEFPGPSVLGEMPDQQPSTLTLGTVQLFWFPADSQEGEPGFLLPSGGDGQCLPYREFPSSEQIDEDAKDQAPDTTGKPTLV